jgi:dTDP-4-dehydrorhamnose 3,5-epimerase
MQIEEAKISGLKRVSPRIFHDERGFFFESYSQTVYETLGILSHFVQDNCSFSYKNTLRGLHYQEYPQQDKLIWVSRGKIFDVAVDIRKNSPTFGCYEGVYLDDVLKEQFFIPQGFAHGYLVVSSVAIVHYKVSSTYHPQAEKSIRWNDADLAVAWPTVHNPILSKKDQAAAGFRELFLC